MATIIYDPRQDPDRRLNLLASRSFNGEEFQVGPNEKPDGWLEANRIAGSEVFIATIYGILAYGQPTPVAEEPVAEEPVAKRTRTKSVEPTPEP